MVGLVRIIRRIVFLIADGHESSTNKIQPCNRAAWRTKSQRVIRTCFYPDSTVCREYRKRLVGVPELGALELVRLRYRKRGLERHADIDRAIGFPVILGCAGVRYG